MAEEERSARADDSHALDGSRCTIVHVSGTRERLGRVGAVESLYDLHVSDGSPLAFPPTMTV
jgi:hypothetical protein